eukprot:CAMPEP_0195529212 /NCGR_PEP_ID=MMETSP0794_2-20130614/31673_1 /TAXON_ID=515487 /ORGANISM="Stephanopyxis turris, Strain CCMP 815" /LENGTH=215 /DNA_ID=CAMNT_0040660479 /DNA_START=47 /DNA_END=694 /DNA_ORIENTATION=-
MKVFCLMLLGQYHISMAWVVSPQLILLHRLQSSTSLYQSSNPNTNTNNDEFIDPVLRLPLMEAELATLPSTEDSSPLEEEIENARTAAEFGVRRAQFEFYDAFSNSDLSAMDAVWSTQSFCRCVHPAMASVEGRQKVMASWSQVLSASGPSSSTDTPGFKITPSRVRIEICGQTAMCSCVEETPNGGKLEALNVYRREDGEWKMTLHMASPIMVG